MQAFQLLRFGTLLLVSIVFTKSKLTTESIGSYEVFLFISALLCSFWVNGLIQAFLPLYKNNNTFGVDKKGRSPEIFNAFVLISILSLIAVLTLAIFKDSISAIFTKSGEIPFFNLLLLYILFSCPAYLVEYIYLLKNKPGWILRYGSITFFIQFILIAAPAVLGYGMEICVSGLVSISVVRYIWLIIMLRKYSLPVFSFAFIREHISYGYPLIISALLGSSAQYVDSFLVLNKFDAATFAIFRYGAKEFPLVLLIANAFSTAMIPEFSSKEKLYNSLQLLRKRSARLMHLLFPISMAFLLFSNWLYPVVFNDNFTESARIFNIYLLIIISRLVFPHTIIIGLKKTKIVMYASFAELVVNIILSVIFIHLWGIEGVAFATLIAFAIQKIIWLVYNKIVLKIPPKEYVPVTFWAIYSLIILIIYYFVY